MVKIASSSSQSEFKSLAECSVGTSSGCYRLGWIQNRKMRVVVEIAPGMIKCIKDRSVGTGHTSSESHVSIKDFWLN